MKLDKSCRRYLPAALFCAFLLVMMLLFVFLPKKSESPEEKRVLQAAPQFSWNNLKDGTFGKEVEAYLSDHFGGRKFFVGLNAYYNLYTGRNGANGIYRAQDGYLINEPIKWDEGNLQKNLTRFGDFARQNGIPSHLLAVPSTGYILGEKLPAAHLTYHDAEIIAQTAAALQGSIDVIDPTPLFQAQKESGQLYYKTDHHWTTYGAYLAYTQLCETFGLSPTPEAAFQKEVHSGFYGTTYSRSGLWLEQPDDIGLWHSPGARTVRIEENNTLVKEQDSLFFTEHLSEPDQYPVFLDGNHSLVRIKNPEGGDKKLLLVKDSFAHCFAPFLSAHYGEIVMVDLRYYHASLSSLIADEGIDETLFLYGIDNLVNDTNSVWLK